MADRQVLEQRREQQTGMAAVLAIILAIAGYVLVFTGNPIWGLFVEIAAAVCAVIGMVLSVSPRTGGGLTSLLSLILAVIGVVIAILAMVGAIIF